MNESRIPKVIHAVWVGGAPMPALAKQCMESWKTFLPDYELRLWTEENSPMDHPYVQDMYAKKLWAFASDYIRFWALEREGGIYLDMDMEVLKPLDSFLDHSLFVGRSKSGNIESSIIGATPGHLAIRAAREFYDADVERSIRNTSPIVLASALTATSSDGVMVYTSSYFHPCDEGERCSPEVLSAAYARHHWAESWVPYAGVRKFLRRVGVLPLLKRLAIK